MTQSDLKTAATERTAIPTPMQFRMSTLVSSCQSAWGMLKAQFAKQLQKCRRFSAWNHQAIDRLELFGLSHKLDLGAKALKGFAVGIKVAL